MEIATHAACVRSFVRCRLAKIRTTSNMDMDTYLERSPSRYENILSRVLETFIRIYALRVLEVLYVRIRQTIIACMYPFATLRQEIGMKFLPVLW